MDREQRIDYMLKQGGCRSESSFAPSTTRATCSRATEDSAAGCRRAGRGSSAIFPGASPGCRSDGWFDTGDVAILHPDGVMQITDRSKDVIKSGGEWISSIELENAAVGCPGVAEAAAVGIAHPKWDERPLLLVVKKEGAAVTPEQILDHLSSHVAKWWLPDEILFVESLPHTATGKLLKTAIREQYKDHKLASAG
jgi:fatty-acyl-CoA synthase